MKRFLIDTSVRNAEGTQTWFVDAETEAEALAKFKAGNCDLYESNVEVTSLDDPEISGEVPLDDFGAFAPEEALTCSVCGVETQNPWHFSTPTSRHEHACDKCWPTAQQVQQESVPIYQYKMSDGSWIDQKKDSHDYNVRHGKATVRIVYTTPPPQSAPVQRPVWVDVAIRGDMARAVFDAIRVAVPGLGPWKAFDALEVQRMADALKPFTDPPAQPAQTAAPDAVPEKGCTP